MEVSSCSNSPKYSSDSSLLDDFWSELDKINDSNQIGSHSYDLDDENMKSVEGNLTKLSYLIKAMIIYKFMRICHLFT